MGIDVGVAASLRRCCGPWRGAVRQLRARLAADTTVPPGPAYRPEGVFGGSGTGHVDSGPGPRQVDGSARPGGGYIRWSSFLIGAGSAAAMAASRVSHWTPGDCAPGGQSRNGTRNGCIVSRKCVKP